MAFQIILQETNDYLDLKADTDIAKTAGWFDLRDLAARSGEYTNTFTIPASSKNKKALKLDMPAPDNSLAYAKVPVLITENGLPFLQGFLQIISDEVDIDAGKYEITVSVQGNYTDWLNTVSEAELKDLPALSYNWGDAYGGNPVDYVYTMLSDGGVIQYHAGYWHGGDFTPSVLYKNLLTNIFKAAGFNVTFPNFGANSAFERLIIPVIEREEYGKDFIDRRYTKISDDASPGGTGTFISNTTDIDFATLLSSPTINEGADRPYGAEATLPSFYQAYGGIEVEITLKCNVAISRDWTRIVDLVLTNEAGVLGQRQLIRYASFNIIAGAGFISEQINQTYKVVVPAETSIGVQLRITQGVNGSFGGIYTFEQDADGDCFIEFKPTGKSIKFENGFYSQVNGWGDLVTFRNSLYNRLDLKQKDVIKYACTAFGMYPVTEGDTVNFKLLDGAVNNSEPKPDISKFINLDKYSRSFDLPQAQQNLFQYDNDTSDTLLGGTNPLTTIAEGNVLSPNTTLPRVKQNYLAPFSYSITTPSIPNKNWDGQTRPFLALQFPLLAIGKYKPDYFQVNTNRYRRYEIINRTINTGGINPVRYEAGDIIMYMGNYLRCINAVSNTGTAPIDSRVINAGGFWEFVDYEDINEGGGAGKPRVCLYATVNFVHNLYNLTGGVALMSNDYFNLAYWDKDVAQTFWTVYSGAGEVPFVTDLTSLSFAELIAQFSKIITGAYQYSEVYRLEARLTNTQVDELLNSTGLFINVGNQTLKLTGVFWLNTIDQFRGSGKPVVIELVRL